MSQANTFADLVVPIRPISGQPPPPSGTPPYVPVCFSRLPDEAIRGLPLYIRSADSGGGAKFTLYAGGDIPFTAAHRDRLGNQGVESIYIRVRDQPRLRQQIEDGIASVAANESIALPKRAQFVYESALELIVEALTTRDLPAIPRRLRRAAGAIVSFYQQNAEAFVHFFAALRQDAATSTHAANCAVLIPALGIALGESSSESLASMCLGAMLFDIGMGLLPQDLIAHNGKLSNAQKKYLLEHPELSAQLLRQLPGIDSAIVVMALQHHERLDGSGFPKKLMFDQIQPAARMLAIIDSFDALISFRPHRGPGLSAAAAAAVLRQESPHHYDPQMVQAWTGLLAAHFPDTMNNLPAPKKSDDDDAHGRRRFKRFSTKNPVSLRMLEIVSGVWTQRREVTALAHNLSRGGLGLLLSGTLCPGEYFRARMHLPDGSASFLTGVIVRIRPRPDGFFEAGARFVDLEKEAQSSPRNVRPSSELHPVGSPATPEECPRESPPAPQPVAGECVAASEIDAIPVEGEFLAPLA